MAAGVRTGIYFDGDLKERYEFTPYGQRTVFRSAGSDDPLLLSPIIDSQAWEVSSVPQPYGVCDVGHQGLFFDKEFGLYYNRARMLHPTLMRFLQRDPMGYVDGMNMHECLRSTPVVARDPSGRDWIWTEEMETAGPGTGPWEPVYSGPVYEDGGVNIRSIDGPRRGGPGLMPDGGLSSGERGWAVWTVEITTPHEVTGWIIQEIFMWASVYDCSGNRVESLNVPIDAVGTQPFWEAWRVLAGTTSIPRTGQVPAVDGWETRDEPLCTKGHIRIQGNMKLMTDYELTGDWELVGGLMVTTTTPYGWDWARNTKERYLSIWWSDCPDRKIPTQVSKHPYMYDPYVYQR